MLELIGSSLQLVSLPMGHAMFTVVFNIVKVTKFNYFFFFMSSVPLYVTRISSSPNSAIHCSYSVV